MQKPDDERLWATAQKRVAFRRHFFVYIVVNLFLVALWYFTSYRNGDDGGYWFVYPLFGWGIGVVFNYWTAFHDDSRSIEREFRRLKEFDMKKEEKEQASNPDAGPEKPGK